MSILGNQSDRKTELQVFVKARLNGFNIRFNMRSTLCWIKCWERLNRSSNIVESLLNQILIGLNFHSTSIQHFLCSRKCWMEWCWSRLNTSFNICPALAQHPFNFCWTNVGQMLKPFKRTLTMTNAQKAIWVKVRRGPLNSIAKEDLLLCSRLYVKNNTEWKPYSYIITRLRHWIVFTILSCSWDCVCFRLCTWCRSYSRAHL